MVKLIAGAEALTKLREGRIWTLLASNDAATTLALFQELFLNTANDRLVAQSVLLERLGFAMDDLRAAGFSLQQTPQGYLNYWRMKGWVTRSLTAGDPEEMYGLTPEASSALRLMMNQLTPRAFATESRLASVIHQVIKLDEETNPNPATRLAALHAERARIDQEIEALGRGELKLLSDERAVERAREIIQQANELADDFQNVKGSFEQLNQNLREQLLEAGNSRAGVLEALFNGVDFIKQSDPGRTFEAFWRLLTDVEQSSALEEALEFLLGRRFSNTLSDDERHFLRHITTRLMRGASSVHEVMRVLGHSLNRFVRNETPEHNKRINEVLQQARLAALMVKDTVEPRAALPFSINQSVPQIRSVAQYQLKDPALLAPPEAMKDAAAATMSLATIQALIGQSEIDLRTLRANIADALGHHPSVSLQALLAEYPVPQGFGTVVGYITLGAKHGRIGAALEVIEWPGADGTLRAAELPAITFFQENMKAFHV